MVANTHIHIHKPTLRCACPPPALCCMQIVNSKSFHSPQANCLPPIQTLPLLWQTNLSFPQCTSWVYIYISVMYSGFRKHSDLFAFFTSWYVAALQYWCMPEKQSSLFHLFLLEAGLCIIIYSPLIPCCFPGAILTFYLLREIKIYPP